MISLEGGYKTLPYGCGTLSLQGRENREYRGESTTHFLSLDGRG